MGMSPSYLSVITLLVWVAVISGVLVALSGVEALMTRWQRAADTGDDAAAPVPTQARATAPPPPATLPGQPPLPRAAALY